MPIMGISTSDLKNNGWNLVVAAGMTASSAVVAWGVKKLVLNLLNRLPKPRDPHLRSGKGDLSSGISRLLGVATGVGAAWYINSKISTSRYALITDPSLGKMFKLGAVQTVVGLCIDLIRDGTAFCGVLGAGVAIAGHWSRYSYIGFGLLGAAAGIYHAQR